MNWMTSDVCARSWPLSSNQNFLCFRIGTKRNVFTCERARFLVHKHHSIVTHFFLVRSFEYNFLENCDAHEINQEKNEIASRSYERMRESFNLSFDFISFSMTCERRKWNAMNNFTSSIAWDDVVGMHLSVDCNRTNIVGWYFSTNAEWKNRSLFCARVCVCVSTSTHVPVTTMTRLKPFAFYFVFRKQLSL